MVGGIVWGLVARLLRAEVAYVAVAVGLLAGLGAALARGERKAPLALRAAAVAITALCIGKLLVFQWVTIPDMRRELADPSRETIHEFMADVLFLRGVAYESLRREGSVDDDVDAWIRDSRPGAEAPPALAGRVRALGARLNERVAGWSDAERERRVRASLRANADGIARRIADRYTYADRVVYRFSAWDGLWLLLAITTAALVAARLASSPPASCA